MDASTFSRSVDLRFEEGVGVLTACFEGRVAKPDLDAANARLREMTEGRAVNAVILDARNSTQGYSPAELIDSVEQTLDEITPKRCAFVSLEPRSEALMLIETVSFPYAVRVQAFTSMDEARAWVLGAV